jgi:hypothetical protein
LVAHADERYEDMILLSQEIYFGVGLNGRGWSISESFGKSRRERIDLFHERAKLVGDDDI